MTGAPELVDPAIAERRTGSPGQLPADMPPWMARTITVIDSFSLWTGKVVCWLILPLILADWAKCR